MQNGNETKVCKYCQTEISKKAKVCPNCKKKQGGIVKWIVIGVIVIAIISAVSGGDDEGKKTASTGGKQEEKQEQAIEYMPCTASEMMQTLESNALKAESTYQDKYVELTGRLGNIDSDGKYISILPADDEWAIIGIQCYIQNDDQKSQVAEMTVGDTVTLKGQITDVGEVLGYSLDIDSIN